MYMKKPDNWQAIKRQVKPSQLQKILNLKVVYSISTKTRYKKMQSDLKIKWQNYNRLLTKRKRNKKMITQKKQMISY